MLRSKLLFTMILSTMLIFIGCGGDDDDSDGGTTPSNSPVLAVSTTSLDFGETSDVRTFEISNSGGGELEWTLSCDEDWLHVTPNSGLTTNEDDVITVTVDRAGLYAEDYSGTITIDPNDGINEEIEVSMTVPIPDPIVFWDPENVVLNEDYYLVNSTSYFVPADGYMEIEIDLHSWPGDYGLELLVMTYVDYLNYIEGYSFSAYHLSVYSTGTRTLVTGTIEEGEAIRVVVDNTSEGWDGTDFDFVDDAAYFDLNCTFQAY